MERASTGGVTVISEGLVLDRHGDPVTEGTLDVPTRGDLAMSVGGQVTSSVYVDTERMLSFKSIRFVWHGKMNVQVLPFQWNFCPVFVEGLVGEPDWTPVEKWFARWFRIGDERGCGPPWLGVVHYLSDLSIDEARYRMEVDFGSAPVAALEGLLDALREVGATTVVLGVTASASSPD